MNNKIEVVQPEFALGINKDAEIERAAKQLIRLLPGGKKLSNVEALDLAVYATMTELNPFNGECYYLPGIGPSPGVAGYLVKAQRWLTLNSDGALVRIWQEYRMADITEAMFDKAKGDVAWHCTLFDSVSKELWEQRLIKLATTYSGMGAEFNDGREAALKDLGACPSWTSVGVVAGAESFSGDQYENNKKVGKKPEMWDRNNRAKKRALKGALRQAFPDIAPPDPRFGETIEGISQTVRESIMLELDSTAPKHTEAENLEALGVNPDPVSGKQWDKWADIARRADKVGLKHESPVRSDSLTATDLREMFQKLQPYVLEAEKESA